MSPIPSVVTAFALSAATPSISLGPDPPGQSTSATSQHLLATGGLFIAVAAIVSVAGYFYHGRGSANSVGRNNTWASWSNFLSSIRHRGATGTSTTAANDGRVDLEAGFEQHVSMVYARFFHPTFWNVVECHPATASAPAICVEDEGKEALVSGLRPYGTNSFLDMNDGNRDTAKGVQKTAAVNQGGKPKPEQEPPYDTSTGTSMNFNCKIIGETTRADGFLFVPGQCDNPSETLSTPTVSDSEFACSPYDGILVSPPGPSDDAHGWDSTYSPYDGIATTPLGSSDSFPDASHDSEWELSCLAYYEVETTSNPDLESTCSSHDGISTTSSGSYDDVASDPELEFICSPYGGILTTPPSSSNDSSETLCNAESELISSLRYGNPTTPPKLMSSPRRYGMADMHELAQTLKLRIPESEYGLGWTVDNRDDIRDGPRDGNTISTAPHEGLELMRRLLEELRDPDMDCSPRALSEDTLSQYSEDLEYKGNVPPLTPTSEIRLSPQSTEPPRVACDLPDDGSLYPLTPPSGNNGSVHKPRTRSPVTWFNGRMQVAVVSPPSKAYFRARTDGRILVRGHTWLPYLT